MKRLLPLLFLLSLVSCTTIHEDGQEIKKLGPVTIVSRPIVTLAEKADADIMRFLLVVAAIGFVGLIAGAVSWWLERAQKFPCPWWDELIVASGIVICISLLGILLYPWLKWILISGVVGFASYKILKGFRNRDKNHV